VTTGGKNSAVIDRADAIVCKFGPRLFKLHLDVQNNYFSIFFTSCGLQGAPLRVRAHVCPPFARQHVADLGPALQAGMHLTEIAPARMLANHRVNLITVCDIWSLSTPMHENNW
jgi:hypothetical protein